MLLTSHITNLNFSSLISQWEGREREGMRKRENKMEESRKDTEEERKRVREVGVYRFEVSVRSKYK